MKLQVLKLKHLSKVYRKLTDGILQQICVGKHFLLFDELAGQEQHSYICQSGPPFGRSDELILANLEFLVRIVLLAVCHILNHISEIQDVWWSTVSKKIYPQIDHHHNATKTKTTKVLSPLFTMAVNTMFTLKNDPSKHHHHQSPWQR